MLTTIKRKEFSSSQWTEMGAIDEALSFCSTVEVVSINEYVVLKEAKICDRIGESSHLLKIVVYYR